MLSSFCRFLLNLTTLSKSTKSTGFSVTNFPSAAIVEKDRLIAQLREATTTQESELARLRSEALVSQQTIDTLRPQMSTTTREKSW